MEEEKQRLDGRREALTGEKKRSTGWMEEEKH
jgi:hypothetical protein